MLFLAMFVRAERYLSKDYLDVWWLLVDAIKPLRISIIN